MSVLLRLLIDAKTTQDGKTESVSIKKEGVKINVNKADGEWFINHIGSLF